MTTMTTERRPSDRPRPRIIQRESGALLCTSCGALQPAPVFPCPVEDWRAQVEAFVTKHEGCS